MRDLGAPFLSVYTPTFRRPRLLAECCSSVDAQTRFVDHVIVPDEIGVGIGGMYRLIREHAHRPVGRYVQVLSDDNVLVDDRVAEELEREAIAHDLPDVVMVRGDINGTRQPVNWNTEPVLTKIDLSCFIVRRDVWVANADRWGERYEGDFDFIHHLWVSGFRFHWWDRLVFRALQISYGRPEDG